jgi:endonuclease YncB( thermonuclease family)
MGKSVTHKARLAAWALLCAAGFGIPAVLFFSTHQAPLSGRADPAEAAAESNLDPLPNVAGETAQKDAASPLLREPAREPLSALASPTPPAPPPDPDSLPKRWRLVHKPVATSAGILDIDGVTIVLPGLDTVPTNENCTDANGASWPCGMGARTAFRAYLRGRALNCRLPDQRPDDAILGECLLQGDDPAAWLVKNGWARAKADGPYVSLQSEAVAARRGIFGARPK